jgi:two-component system copper resistance phosphate regulon response regulator CusR
VEDEKIIAENIQKYFSKFDIHVEIETSYEDGLFQAESENYDAIIIDWMLPDGDGVDLAKKIRKSHTTPLLILTAKNQTEDIIHGLNSGADDYVTKPFSLAELHARVNALIRRKNGPSVSTTITIGRLVIDMNTRTVSVGKKNIPLAPKEYLLLEYLALHPNIAIDRMDLLNHIWGNNLDPISNTVDVHIRYIRNKLGGQFAKKLIQTVKGKGYMLCTDSQLNNGSH